MTAFFAAVRSAGSSSLGLAQLPGNPGSMMGARTASAQLGYVLGAAGGGLVIELLGFGALGFVLFAGMAAVRAAGAARGRPVDARGARRAAIRSRCRTDRDRGRRSTHRPRPTDVGDAGT